MRSQSVAAVFIAALTLAIPTYAQTVDEIVAKNIQAKGGAEKLKSISSVKMTGKLTSQGRDVPMVVMTKRPNLLRQEITTPQGLAVNAFDGVTAWTLAPGADVPREITGPQADAARSNTEFDGPLMDYAVKGHTVELVGKEKLGSDEVYHLKLTRKNGDVEHYYLDVNTGLELKRTAEVVAGGMKQTLESELSDYKTVEGMMVPHTIKQSVGGMPVMQMTMEKIEFNPPIDDALFKMPKSGVPAAPPKGGGVQM
jgi:outer membrane lipoprotein-sorting protein